MNPICMKGGQPCSSLVNSTKGYQGGPSGLRDVTTRPVAAISKNSYVSTGGSYTQYILPAILVFVVLIPIMRAYN